jgi:hypothetical protein
MALTNIYSYNDSLLADIRRAAGRTPTASGTYAGDVAVPRPDAPVDPSAPAPAPPAPAPAQEPYRAETLAQQWQNYQPPAAAQPPAWQQGVVEGMLTPTPDPRGTELFNVLQQRATQGLNVSRTDPAIRAQADAYSAQEERASRNYLADVAEKDGPFANMRGETRMASERMGQRVGAFEAELMGRELQARRDEIAQALQLSASLLSTEQQRELQRQMALLDNAIAQQQAGNASLGLNQDWMEALMQNAQFLDDLGARERDRRSYYDLVQSGQL